MSFFRHNGGKGVKEEDTSPIAWPEYLTELTCAQKFQPKLNMGKNSKSCNSLEKGVPEALPRSVS